MEPTGFNDLKSESKMSWSIPKYGDWLIELAISARQCAIRESA
jgi:hypothetical protein